MLFGYTDGFIPGFAVQLYFAVSVDLNAHNFCLVLFFGGCGPKMSYSVMLDKFYNAK